MFAAWRSPLVPRASSLLCTARSSLDGAVSIGLCNVILSLLVPSSVGWSLFAQSMSKCGILVEVREMCIYLRRWCLTVFASAVYTCPPLSPLPFPFPSRQTKGVGVRVLYTHRARAALGDAAFRGECLFGFVVLFSSPWLLFCRFERCVAGTKRLHFSIQRNTVVRALFFFPSDEALLDMLAWFSCPRLAPFLSFLLVVIMNSGHATTVACVLNTYRSECGGLVDRISTRGCRSCHRRWPPSCFSSLPGEVQEEAARGHGESSVPCFLLVVECRSRQFWRRYFTPWYNRFALSTSAVLSVSAIL